MPRNDMPYDAPSARRQSVPLQLPSLGLPNGSRRERGTIDVLKPGKSSRPRFQPGNFLQIGKELFVVRYIYKLAARPNE